MFQHCTASNGNTADEWYIVIEWREVVVVNGSTATAFCAVLCDELHRPTLSSAVSLCGNLGIFLDLLQRKYIQRVREQITKLFP